jgi:hypothetical protein
MLLPSIKSSLESLEEFDSHLQFVSAFIEHATSSKVEFTETDLIAFSEHVNKFSSLAADHYVIAKKLQQYLSAARIFTTANTELPGL